MKGTKERVLEAVTQAAGRPKGNPYVSNPRDNFIESISEDQITTVLAMIARGDGGELVPKGWTNQILCRSFFVGVGRKCLRAELVDDLQVNPRLYDRIVG